MFLQVPENNGVSSCELSKNTYREVDCSNIVGNLDVEELADSLKFGQPEVRQDLCENKQILFWHVGLIEPVPNCS